MLERAEESVGNIDGIGERSACCRERIDAEVCPLRHSQRDEDWELKNLIEDYLATVTPEGYVASDDEDEGEEEEDRSRGESDETGGFDDELRKYVMKYDDETAYQLAETLSQKVYSARLIASEAVTKAYIRAYRGYPFTVGMRQAQAEARRFVEERQTSLFSEEDLKNL